jgi:hypothetical protein
MKEVSIKALAVFTGSSKEITLAPDEYSLPVVKEFYRQNMKALKDGRYVKVSLELWYRRRTLNQNSLWHKMLMDLSHKLYMDMDLIKEGIKELAAAEYGYPYIKNDITHTQSPKPSHKATVREMEILFNVTYIIAAENNVDLSLYQDEISDWRKKNENS